MTEITYTIIVGIMTLILGAITKAFVEVIPDKFIPLQNLIIGALSAIVCIYFKIETNIIQAIVLCIVAAMGAGGTYDLIKTKSEDE